MKLLRTYLLHIVPKALFLDSVMFSPKNVTKSLTKLSNDDKPINNYTCELFIYLYIIYLNFVQGLDK